MCKSFGGGKAMDTMLWNSFTFSESHHPHFDIWVTHLVQNLTYFIGCLTENGGCFENTVQTKPSLEYILYNLKLFQKHYWNDHGFCMSTSQNKLKVQQRYMVKKELKDWNDC